MVKKQQVTYGRKFEQVCEGAARIFLRDGYAGASVDDISTASKVSKATLYSYFPDKRLMFEEVIRGRVAQIAEHSPLNVPEGASAREGVPLLARQIAGWLITPANLRLFRLQVAEAARFPGLAQTYHAAVVTILHDPLRVLLERWATEGQLRLQDSRLATGQLIRLAGAELHVAVLLGGRHPAPDEVARIAESAARIFLLSYAVADGFDLSDVGDEATERASPHCAMR